MSNYPGMSTPDRNSKPASIRTVLVLDGDVLVRMPVVQYLRECGYRVVEAANTDEAIIILQKTSVPVDVVLSGKTDLAMSRPTVVIVCMFWLLRIMGPQQHPTIFGTHVPVEEPSTFRS